MGEVLNTVLQRIRNLRQELEISPEDMAKATDIPLEEYLSIENGESDLFFTFLYKCSNRLGVDLSAMITGDEPHLSGYTLSRDGDGIPIKRRKGFSYTHLAYLFKNRIAEPFVVVAKYSDDLEDSPITLATHKGQEFDYILDGNLKVQIGEHIEYLSPGDSVFYDAGKPHGMVAVNGRDCKFIAVVIKGSSSESIDMDHNHGFVKKISDSLSQDNRIYKKFVNESLDENGLLEKVSFNVPDNFNFAYDCVDYIADKYPLKRAMLYVAPDESEKEFTFDYFKKYSNKAANYFLSMGIKKGDKVMLVLRRHYQFWTCILALHKIGAIVIPATDQLTAKDFIYRFNSAGVKAVVCTSFGCAADMILEALPQSPTIEHLFIVNCDGNPKKHFADFDAEIEKQSDILPRIENSKDDPMLIYFTSGTTGYPKMVLHSFSYPIGHIVTAKWWHNICEDGLHFTLSETGWGKAAWGKLYGQWFCETAIFVCDFIRFKPVNILPMFKKYNITTFCAPPTVFRFFIKEDLSNYDLSSLRYATIAGEALNAEVYNKFYESTGIKLMEGFGQTETPLIIGNFVGTEPRPGSMGKPSPAFDIRLLDEQGKQVKVGNVGQIAICTKNGIPQGMFSGYYLNAEKTNEVWKDDFYYTGDMAWQDEDGYFWYVSRSDDVIKSSGYRIGPFEIESVLMEMSCITECAVTGVPDTAGERGQLVKATIVLAKGYSPSDELKKEIQNYVKRNTAPYKYPREIDFVETLPKTISGKIKRAEIRQQKSTN